MTEREITLSKAVIHEIIKEQHNEIESPRTAPQTLDTSYEPVLKLVTEVVRLYGKRNNAAHYGTFRNDGREGRFPENFASYRAATAITDEQFLSLTVVATEELHALAKRQPLATGGYLLFADYQSMGVRFFLIAMIKQTDGLRLSKDLVPEELMQLDLKRLHQAARINFEKLLGHDQAGADERPHMTYLSFVSPSASKATAGYFVEGLGCKPGTASVAATKSVISVVPGFFWDRPQLKSNYRRLRDALIDLLSSKAVAGDSVSLDEIEVVVRQYIPVSAAQEADALIEELVANLNSEDSGVPVEFPVAASVVQKAKRIAGDAPSWNVSFERSALGTTDDADVFFIEGSGKIVLSNLPGAMIEQIRVELSQRNIEE